jgi:hypothetical protein
VAAAGRSGSAYRCLGWSGRLGAQRPAGGLEEVHPLGLAVPPFGQVQGDSAPAMTGDPGGDAIPLVLADRA